MDTPAETLAQYIADLVANAPQLTAEQSQMLAVQLRS